MIIDHPFWSVFSKYDNGKRFLPLFKLILSPSGLNENIPVEDTKRTKGGYQSLELLFKNRHSQQKNQHD